MNKALEFTHDLWITAQLKPPPFVQHTVVPRLHEAKEIVRLLTRLYLPICQLEGQGQGGPLTVDYVGLEFNKLFLKSLIFVGDPVERQVGRIPFWRYNEIEGLSSSDMTIVEAARHLIRRLPRQNAVVFPEFINHILDVRGDWQDIKSRFHKGVRRELRLTQRYGYQYEVSHSDQDFEMFYHDMYLPTMKARHGALAHLVSASKAYQYFRHGLLFFVKRDGQRVCGSICYLEQDMIYFKILGVINGDQQLIKEGAVGALNCLRIQWANQHGYKALNFLGSRTLLSSGLFQYKRKWGTSVRVSPKLHRQIWIKIRHFTPAVSQFLKENPFIVLDKNGKLHGLIIVDDPHNVPAETRKEWEKRYITPGLSSLLIQSVNNFADSSADVSDPDLMIPVPPSPSSEN